MPTNTYFNLLEEKRKKIEDAAFDEFVRVPLRDVKISNIIKNASIPRGSFYQYFENIEDLFNHVYLIVTNSYFKSFYKYIKDDNRDLFSILEQIFIHEYKYSDSIRFHKYMRHFMESNKSDMRCSGSIKNEMILFYIKLSVHVDKTNIKNEYKNSLLRFLKYYHHTKVFIILRCIKKKCSAEEALKIYRWHMSIFKNGCLEEDCDD